MSDSGHTLRENNEQIVRLMSQLKKQRKEMNFLIEKQELEKGRIQTEIEKLSFKLSLLTKSLVQRIQARNNYDKTIQDIESNYGILVEESGRLLTTISKEVNELEQIMDKKIGTSITSNNSVEERNANLIKDKELQQQPKAIEKEPSLTSAPETEEESEDEEIKPNSSLMDEIREEDETNISENNFGRSKSASAEYERKLSEGLDSNGPRRYSNKSNTSSIDQDRIKSDISTNEERRRSSDAHRSSKSSSRSVDLSMMHIKPEKVIDAEVQSYREAYGRQHSVQAPIRSSTANSLFANKPKEQ